MAKNAAKKVSKEFNDKSKLAYEITIPVGDWSDDGHGKMAEVTFMTSHKVDDIRKAYLKSVKDFGVSFDHDHKAPIVIATEYEEHGLSTEAQTRLTELGYDMKRIKDSEFLSPSDLGDIIMWFAGKSLKDFEYEKKDKTYLNGYWNKDLNVQFGYGLFGG